MDEDFNITLQFIFKWENVYDKKGNVIAENDPDDPGGLTKYGVDQRSNPDVDVANLTKEQAAQLYWAEWVDCSAGKLPFPLSMAYFDAVVNTGKSQATRLLQRSCGAVVDGILGPKTLEAALGACENIGVEAVAKKLCWERTKFYIKLVEQDPKFTKFKRGWLNRTSDLEREINIA